MPWNPDTEQSAIGETANDALVAEATRPLPEYDYTEKVDKLFDRAAELKCEAQDFVDLCLAAADQAGLDVHGLTEIAAIISMRLGATPQWGIR